MSSGRRLAAVGIVLLVLAGCDAGPVIDMPTRPASATPESPTPSATVGIPFPPGLETVTSGKIYAEVDGGVVRIDVAGRKVHLVPAPNLASFKSFVATPGLLVVKQIDDAVGFVIDNGGDVGPLPSELGGPGRLYAGVGDRIWVVPEQPGDGHRVLSQFGTAALPPRLLKRRNLSDAFDLPDSDLAGQPLSWKGDVPYVVSATAATRLLPRWRKGWELIDLATGRTTLLPGVLTRLNPNDQVAWLDRGRVPVLLAVTDRRLHVVDAGTGKVNTWSEPGIDRVTVA